MKVAYQVDKDGNVYNSIVVEDGQDLSIFKDAILPPKNQILAVGGKYIDGVAYSPDGFVIPPMVDDNLTLVQESSV